MTHTVSAAAPSPAQASINAAAQARIRRTSQDFEATFLSSMFQTMFQGVDVSQPFGGGQAETTFRSFLTDAMARQVVRAGGIGLAASVEREMVRLQAAGQTAASPSPAAAPTTPATPVATGG